MTKNDATGIISKKSPVASIYDDDCMEQENTEETTEEKVWILILSTIIWIF